MNKKISITVIGVALITLGPVQALPLTLQQIDNSRTVQSSASQKKTVHLNLCANSRTNALCKTPHTISYSRGFSPGSASELQKIAYKLQTNIVDEFEIFLQEISSAQSTQFLEITQRPTFSETSFNSSSVLENPLPAAAPFLLFGLAGIRWLSRRQIA